MIIITCDKCGRQDSNPSAFGNRRFSFTDDSDNIQQKNLCNNCQKDLAAVEDAARAEFFGVASVRDFGSGFGIVVA